MSGRPLRIAQFITQYPYPKQFEGGSSYYCAGAARVAQELSEAFASKGHEVHAYTASDGLKYEKIDQKGVVVHRSPSLTRINTTQIPPSILIDHVTDHGFDVIHAHNSTPPGMLAAYGKSKLEGTPLIITHHGGEHYESHGGLVRRGGLYLYTRVLMGELFGHAAKVVIPSEGYVEESRILSTPDVDVTRIRNGVSVETFDIDMSPNEAKKKLGLATDQFTVLYMGAHHRRKGPHILVEAFKEVVEEVDNAKLIMAGSGDLTESLRHEATVLGISDHVDFPGFVSEAKKPTYLKAADVFVLPSTTGGAEMFPLAILEAAAAGTPVVTTSFPTLRSIIEEYDIGELVPPRNASSLAQTIANLYDSDRLEQYSSNALRMAIDHNWDEIADEYLSLYRRVME